MAMIVACHILQGLNNSWAFWVNVGVQIFLFISGYLYGNKKIKDIKGFYKGRLKKVLLPYSIFAAIIFIVEYFCIGNKYAFSSIIGSLLGFGAFNGNASLISHTWFVSYILICYALVPLLQRIFGSESFKKNLFYLAALMVFIQLLEFFSVMRINACWINNFILGYFYTKCCSSVNTYNKQSSKKIMNIIFTCCFLAIMPFAIIYQEKLAVPLPQVLDHYSIYFINYGHVFLGIIIFIVLYKLLDCIKLKENVVLNFLDRQSYYIYLVHQVFILNTFSLLFVTESLAVNILLIIAAVLVSASLLKKICELVNSGFKRVSALF